MSVNLTAKNKFKEKIRSTAAEGSSAKLKIEKYLNNAKPLFENLEVQIPERVDMEKTGKEFREMALAYYNDSLHFYEKGEYANALGALEYAEGWLDAGKALGIFKTNKQ